MWVDCELCQKWNHPQCEVKYGTDAANKAAAIQIIKEEEEENQMLIDAAESDLL